MATFGRRIRANMLENERSVDVAHAVQSGRERADFLFLAGSLALVLLFNGLLEGWIVLRPAGHSTYAAVDNYAQVVGPLAMLPFLSIAFIRRGSPHFPAGAVLLGLGVVTDTFGQSVWTFYAQVLHRATPFPSWADASYLATYPLFLGGILLLLGRSHSHVKRARVTLDGLMIMTAAATFSWYFVLGPTVLGGNESLFAKAVGTAYPLGDLLLIASLLVLTFHGIPSRLRSAVAVLGAGLLAIILADSVFDYQTLHDAYSTGEVIDVGWPLGDMLVCLAAWLALRSSRVDEESLPGDADQPKSIRLWVSLLPYAFVPAVGGLLLYTLSVSGDEQLQHGVIAGSVILLLMALARQVLEILENARLSARLFDQNDALQRVNLRLEQLATTDPLTGLANHRAMVTILDKEVERARRYGRPCSLLFLDLDHFKALNDSLGHQDGDAALKEVSQVLRAAVRGIDTVGRWGGEEFVIILPEAPAVDATAVAERVRAQVAQHLFTQCGGVHLTCSIGVATYPDDAEGRDALVELADRAMYVAKHLGRNQVRGIGEEGVASLASSQEGNTSRDDLALRSTVELLAVLVETRDRYTGQHARDVSSLSVRVALALGLSPTEARVIGMAAKLHDIGKVGVPDAVLQKPGPLSPEEWVVMRQHPVVGAEVVSRVPALRPLTRAIRAHHERWAGGGYPDGLSFEEIPVGARIIGAADAYGAMTTDRPYRAAMSSGQAIDELRRCSGTQFDPAVVEALRRVVAVESEESLRAG